ncbi:Cys/Met metabolism PLP-dependent enzyme-domain-containing protein [Mycena sp. CBHHK59/15]|nr:Cys/Met metabolism PLP-dependent enzyme-domain-containing protein [Mycena sp. CBHHK59/15]
MSNTRNVGEQEENHRRLSENFQIPSILARQETAFTSTWPRDGCGTPSEPHAGIEEFGLCLDYIGFTAAATERGTSMRCMKKGQRSSVVTAARRQINRSHTSFAKFWPLWVRAGAYKQRWWVHALGMFQGSAGNDDHDDSDNVKEDRSARETRIPPVTVTQIHAVQIHGMSGLWALESCYQIGAFVTPRALRTDINIAEKGKSCGSRYGHVLIDISGVVFRELIAAQSMFSNPTKKKSFPDYRSWKRNRNSMAGGPNRIYSADYGCHGLEVPGKNKPGTRTPETFARNTITVENEGFHITWKPTHVIDVKQKQTEDGSNYEIGRQPRDRRFDWDVSPKFKGTFSENYNRRTAFALKMKWEMLRDMGGWLDAHLKVTWVSYPSLKYHPDHAWVVKSLRENTFSGIVCFGIAGHPRNIVDNLKLASNLSHMGDAKTLIIHPGSTTNQSMADEEVLASGVRRDLIRVSVGIENIVDIIADFSQALERVAAEFSEWFNIKYPPFRFPMSTVHGHHSQRH